MSQPESTTGTADAARLPASLRLGPVHLTVTDLGRSISFYRDKIGLRLHNREDAVAVLGAGEQNLLFLYEEPDARRATRDAGLYHFALLHSSRQEMSRTVQRLFATEADIQGATDHGISEAIYLTDPDGNGVELYADRPRDVWPALSRPMDVIKPLDLGNLAAVAGHEDTRPEIDPKLVVGHLHLHVGDLESGLAFYRDTLGFDLVTFISGAAAFVSAGGYHHHLAFNLWRGGGAKPAPTDAVGLRHWTIVLEKSEEVDEVRARVRAAGREIEKREEGGFLVLDPWNIATVFTYDRE